VLTEHLARTMALDLDDAAPDAASAERQAAMRAGVELAAMSDAEAEALLLAELSTEPGTRQ
jgi:hypothetical protein